MVAQGRDTPYWQNATYMQGWAQFKLGDLDKGLASFFNVVDSVLSERSFEDLPATEQELLTDSLRVVTLALAYLDGPETLASAETARPGDVIEYRATYANAGDSDIHDLLPTLPIPDATYYLAATANPGEIEASTDGRAFAPVPLMRKAVRENGEEIWEEVPFEEYRFLRWRVATLPAHESVTVSARVAIPNGAPANPEKRPAQRH